MSFKIIYYLISKSYLKCVSNIQHMLGHEFLVDFDNLFFRWYMDRAAWQATVHELQKVGHDWSNLAWFSTQAHIGPLHVM